ncbi:MAG TPA: MBL fold metallo-hydrolase [Candidatus Faecalicoccus intestinipullorum]|nr:MBL fold metallo-hydrolase [Candidatus Faecalicoccus intestinipullorum]
MKKMFFLIVLGCWVSLIIDDPFLDLIWIFLYVLVLAGCSKRVIWLFIWGIFSLFFLVLDHQLPVTPKEGEYTIYQIRENYVLAQNKNIKVIVYGIDDPMFYDVIYLSEFEKVHSLKNLSLFSFVDYLKEDNIFFQSNVDQTSLVRRQQSLKGDIYDYFSKKDPYWKMTLYGIYNDSLPELMSRLSLPVVGLVSIVEKHLRRWRAHLYFVYGFSFLLLILWGSLFVFTTSILRMACHRFSKILLKDWQAQFIVSTFVFFVLMPEKASSFAFVLPSAMNLIYHLCSDTGTRYLIEKSVLCGLQYLYFHEVDFMVLIFFGLLRKSSGIFFIFSLILLGLNVDLFVIWSDFLDFVPQLIWLYDAGFVYVAAFILLLFGIYRAESILRKIIYSSILAFIPFILPFLDCRFCVTVFDIGQGDCTLITEPFHKSAVMIDCGQNLYRDNMEEIVLPYLELKHIKQLDCLIVTHDDFDHSGGVDSLKKNITINKIIRSSDETIPVEYPFYSLLVNRQTKDENDKSIISYFSYDGFDYLWMGDASVDVEEQLIHAYPQLNCNVLKAGHHGSRTSSSYSFLNQVEPKLALISVGYQNRYGHPDIEVLKNMQTLGISNLRTSDVGMIQIQSFRGLCVFQTGTNIFGIIQK